MRAPPDNPAGTGATGPLAGPDEHERIEADGVHRGRRASTGRRQPSWLRYLLGRFEAVRPPRWYASPLVLVAALAGLVTFSTAWTVMGDAVVAVSIATIVGACFGTGTVVAGSLVWTRLADEPAATGY